MRQPKLNDDVAGARIKGGIVRPSAAAVFKLTTNSSLVAC